MHAPVNAVIEQALSIRRPRVQRTAILADHFRGAARDGYCINAPFLILEAAETHPGTVRRNNGLILVRPAGGEGELLAVSQILDPELVVAGSVRDEHHPAAVRG